MTELSTAAKDTKPPGTGAPQSSRPPSPSRWKWFLALGVVLLLLGATGISLATFLATFLDLSFLLVFGPMLLASGLAQGMFGFIAVTGKESLLHLAAGGVEGILGLWLMAAPLDTGFSLVALIATVLIVSGLIRLARSLATRSRDRSWIIMTGVVALLLGVAVWIGGSAVRWWFVGLCLAVDFFCHGVSWSAVALAERKPLEELAP